MGWVSKIYYFVLLRALEGNLTRWFRLHLQSLAATPLSRRVDVRQAQHDEKHVVLTPFGYIREEKKKDLKIIHPGAKKNQYRSIDIG
jgi:hypothetical protein